MKIFIIFLCIWGIVGFAYFAYDTIQNEERWSRDPGSTLAYFAFGPLVWMMGISIFLAAAILLLLEFFRGH